MIDWPEWPGYETCDGWSREVLVQRFTELRLAYKALEEQADADIIPRFPQPETAYFQITALKRLPADASGIALTTNSWWACPDCGGLAVANRIGWRCTRCGAHREWDSEPCPGDYCEDGCTRCVGTP